jgi:hypothetical protein
MSVALELPERAAPSPDVLHQLIEGRAVLLDLNGERYYSLDDVGTRIWTLLAEHDKVETILARLLEVYAVDRATLSADLASFLGKLAQAGLIQLTPDAPTA